MMISFGNLPSDSIAQMKLRSQILLSTRMHIPLIHVIPRVPMFVGWFDAFRVFMHILDDVAIICLFSPKSE